MKELSIEQKAQRYDKVVDKLKQFMAQGVDPLITRADVQDFFPELKESEDERIKNFISNELACLIATDGKGTIRYNELTEAIAWLEKQNSNVDNANKEYWRGYREGKQEILDKYAELEKQGEQKETLCNKCKKTQPSHSCQDITELGRCAVEHEQKPVPKFHGGDWLVSVEHGNVVRVLEVLKDNYRLDFDGNTIGTLCTELIDKDYRLWNITKDAKPGDVLAGHESYVIFKEIDGLNIKCHCTYHYMGFKPSFYINTLQNKDAFHPATKEQRDALMKAMANAGYTFDFEKKELKKIEKKPQRMISAEAKEAMYSKPAEWSEEDELHIRELESLVKRVWATAEHENDKDTIHKMSGLSFFLKTLKAQKGE